jgi:rhodanese-related sulfurtransferase/rubrerythrin
MTQPLQMMDSDQARSFMDGHKPDAYTLLDVRQQWEYEEFHLPGAQLLPLPELMDRVGEVDRTKPVVVYCRSGGRSMAAATLLDNQGYGEIINLVGGAMGWQGATAVGPIDLGMIEFSGTEAPQEVVLKAYAMENSLQQFYLKRADVAESLERIELFMELAGFEDRHKETLYTLYSRVVDSQLPRDMFEEVAFSSVKIAAEGGVDIQAFVEENADAFEGDHGILQMAAMVEAQAMDYYLRCARLVENAETEEILQLLAREEKAHLKLLGKFMDRRDQGKRA